MKMHKERLGYNQKKITGKQLVFSFITVASLVLFAVLSIVSSKMTGGLSDQQAAKRWDKEGGAAQVSCFLTRGTTVDEFTIKGFEKQLETALAEAAVVSEKENSRLYADAYSAQGKITVVSEQGTLEADAVGIGGDFFLFHPLQLVSGGYFSGNDLMKDSVILDEEAAWQLFGSSDIAGMTVTIGNVPHYVEGVIKRQSGHFAEAAGLKDSVVYVSHETLSAYGTSEGINTYEVVGPNPVKGFLANVVREDFGFKEQEMQVVENSARYSLEAMISVVLAFGTRSMQNAAIHYPYWENIARGYEDVRALLLFFQFIFLLIPAVIIVVFLIIKWKHRTVTAKDVIHYLSDKKDRALEICRLWEKEGGL